MEMNKEVIQFFCEELSARFEKKRQELIKERKRYSYQKENSVKQTTINELRARKREKEADEKVRELDARVAAMGDIIDVIKAMRKESEEES